MKRCKWLLALILLVNAGCNLSALTGESTPPATPDTGVQDWSQYHSDDLKFSIQYPAAWSVEDNADGFVYFWSDEQFGGEVEPVVYYVYVAQYPNSDRLPVEDIATEGLPDELKATLVFTSEAIGEFTAHMVEGLPSRSGSLTAFMTRNESRYIALALTPYDSQTPWMEQERFVQVFEAMLATFQME